MRNDYITRQVRRCSRNLALVGIVILLFSLSLVFLAAIQLARNSPRPRVKRDGRREEADDPRGMLFTGAGCSLFGLVPLGMGLARIINPNVSPIVRRLKKLGNADALRASLDAEMSQGLARRLGKLQYTPSWLVNEMYFDTDIGRVDDVVSLYQLETRSGAGSSFTAVFRLRTKAGFSVIARPAEVEEMLTLFHDRVPWAIHGWSAELDTMWRKDREGLIRLVEQRYQQYLSPFGLKAEDNTQSSPDERIRQPNDYVKPSEPSSPEELTNE
jgi:hypothetical protein